MGDVARTPAAFPLPRVAASALGDALAVMPVVVVMGARQTGKSTFARHHTALSDHRYLTLDDLSVLGEARNHPEDLVSSAPRVVLDEVQRHPELLLEVKRQVDEETSRRPGRFVLTGSANLHLMNRIRESLAGRASYLTVWPMTRAERQGAGQAGMWSEFWKYSGEDWGDLLRERSTEPGDWRRSARIGGYPVPAVHLGSDREREIWFGGYVDTYLTRDLQQLSAIENLVDFRRLMRIACLRLGNMMNKAEMARDAGLSQPTAHRYLSLLETSYQLVSLPAYAVNRTKRLVKSPKTYWSDTALALFLSGAAEPAGAHLENLVLTDLMSWRDALSPGTELTYWRTRTGEEVDFVVERGSSLLAVEVKSGRRVRTRDLRGVRAFMEEYGDRVRGGLVLYDGEETYRAARDVWVTPWWRVL